MTDRAKNLAEENSHLEKVIDNLEQSVYVLESRLCVSYLLLTVLGLTEEQINLVNSIYDLEEDGRVSYLGLRSEPAENGRNLGIDVYLEEMFSSKQTLAAYLQEKGLPRESLSKKGRDYILRSQGLEVRFLLKK